MIVDTDPMGAMELDPFAMRRTIFDLLGPGVDRETVRNVIYGNPRVALDLDLPA